MPGRHVRIGTRRSKLAMEQSRSVVERLRALHPDDEFQVVEITTEGDRHQHVPLDVLGGEGVFVRELEEALMQERIDMAVHSAKDMPTNLPDGLRLTCVPERTDSRDVLVSHSDLPLSELPAGARVGTGSQRRAVQVLARRTDVRIVGLRGNIETRIRKVTAGECECVVLAAAALVRLRMEDRIAEYLSPDSFVPAVAQGALAVEVRESDPLAQSLLDSINDSDAFACVCAERAFLRALGGGCRAPIAASASIRQNVMLIHGLVSDPCGGTILRAESEGDPSAPDDAGQELAARMLAMGASQLLQRSNE